jgi:hypothetical protein
LLSAHDFGSSGDHDQGVNSTGVTSIAHPSPSVPGRPFHEQPHAKSLEEGSSFYFHQQESAYATSPQVLSYHFATQSQVPAMVSDNVYCGSGGHRGTAAYPARAPAGQWDAQVSWGYTLRSVDQNSNTHLYDYRRPSDRSSPLQAICNRHLSHTLR